MLIPIAEGVHSRVRSGAKHWGAVTGSGTPDLTLLTVVEHQTVIELVGCCFGMWTITLFFPLPPWHVTVPQWLSHWLWRKQDWKGKKQQVRLSFFFFFQPSAGAFETPRAGLREAGCGFLCQGRKSEKSCLSHLWLRHGLGRGEVTLWSWGVWGGGTDLGVLVGGGKVHTAGLYNFFSPRPCWPARRALCPLFHGLGQL